METNKGLFVDLPGLLTCISGYPNVPENFLHRHDLNIAVYEHWPTSSSSLGMTTGETFVD